MEIYEGSVGKPMMSATLRNLRDFPRALTWSALTSGLLIVLISCTGPVAMVLQAARVGHFNQNQTASWLWACWVGSGVFGLLLSLRYRIPIIGAWSTPSVALLITGLADHSLAEAVSAYLVSAALIIIVGVTGIFQKLLDLVPRPVIMAIAFVINSAAQLRCSGYPKCSKSNSGHSPIGGKLSLVKVSRCADLAMVKTLEESRCDFEEL